MFYFYMFCFFINSLVLGTSLVRDDSFGIIVCSIGTLTMLGLVRSEVRKGLM